MVACQTVSRIFIRVLSHTSCRVASELNMIIELFQTCSRRCLKTALLKSFFRHALLQALYQSLTILGKLQIKRAKLNFTETQEARESALLSSEQFFLFVCLSPHESWSCNFRSVVDVHTLPAVSPRPRSGNRFPRD